MMTLIVWQRLRVLLVVIFAITGCGDGGSSAPVDEGIARQVLGDGMLSYRQQKVDPVGIAVWFHGMDSEVAPEVRLGVNQRRFFEPFLRAKWVIVAADAEGNAFGNDPSVSAYRKLVDIARAEYGQALPVVFLAESMGTLPALRMYQLAEYKSVRGLVAVSPLTGIPASIQSVDYIRGPWGGGGIPYRANPLGYPISSYGDRRFLFFYSPGDSLIPPNASARAFASRFGKAAEVRLEVCQGGHVDPTCYRGDVAFDFVLSGS